MLGVAFAEAGGATEVLYVTGADPPAEGDQRVVFQLERMGLTVTIVDDDVVTSGDASGRDLVFLSSTVSGAAIGNEFTAVAIPLVSRQSDTFAALGMTGAVEGSSYDIAAAQTSLQATGGHALSAGLAGTITLSATAPSDVHWGAPGPAAAIGATLDGNPGRAASFGYEAGAAMVVGTAPARRVGLFLDDDTSLRWSADAQDLFRAALRWALGEELEDRIRVLPLGDSITDGRNGTWSWRRPLSELFVAARCRVDLTGTLFGPESGAPGDFLYDRDHEAHRGYQTGEVVAELDLWLQGSVPDVVLIHLGTNDVYEFASLTDAKESLRTVIGQLRAANPEVVILLAQIIPIDDPASADDVPILNGYIAELAGEETTDSSPVVLVDAFTGYDPVTMSQIDGLHPNELGEQQIASRFFASMRPRIGPWCEVTPLSAMRTGGRVLLGTLLVAGGLLATLRRTAQRALPVSASSRR